ncbi:Polyketide cyclase / dehydrase and lipid transport [Shimia sp. SK013]|uniref:SRPBCC family protein n=1 Tax=Shimia sp. SK013 TaxID=1389006 RepID=UPI0006B69945|nr:SRPBCC family protein [Shimia sp. SK013]KPA22455.1 Polyketide cyclase / dehydrase and lipid transport [Shimia sp. SK013]
MPEVTVHTTINAPVEDVWTAWDDYAHIEKFNPNLSRSFLLDGSHNTGLGAERQCTMTDGKNFIQERIVDYQPNRRMKVEIFDGTFPLKENFATIDMRQTGPNKTELHFKMEFVPKYGLLGRLMVPMMKPQFRKLLGSLIDANKAYIERGEVVARAA